MTAQDAQAMQRFVEVAQRRADEAVPLYARIPELRTTADALLGEEKRVHHRDGWDGMPALFFLRESTRSGRLKRAELNTLTTMLRDEVTRMPVVAVLDHLAHVTEVMNQHRDMLPWTPGTGEDLFSSGAGYRFHGLAVTSIADAHVLGFSGATKPTLRMTYYAGRDGWVFEVWRLRGDAQTPGARWCIPSTPDGGGSTGGIPEAMTRLVNAIAANPVPVRWDDADDREYRE